MERRIKSLVRWNAMAMVVRANKEESGIGGHISTFASAATLYEVAFNHFFRARTESGDRDIVYYQGHAAPGIYSRAFLEGRLPKEKLENFRRELKAGGGLSFLSSSLADARFLGVPHRQHGPGTDSVHLSRAVHQISGESRTARPAPAARFGRFSATAKWTSRSRWARSRWLRARSSTI